MIDVIYQRNQPMTTAEPVVFVMQSPYNCDKIKQIFVRDLPEELLVDEFAGPLVNPKEMKTYYVAESYELTIAPPEGTEALVFPPCSSDCLGSSWDELQTAILPKSIKVIDLGHDGVIWGIRSHTDDRAVDEEQWEDETACRAVLNSLPNLEKVYYCGYYSQIDYDIVAKDYPNIVFEAIY